MFEVSFWKEVSHKSFVFELQSFIFVLTACDRWHVDLTLSELRRVEKKAFAVLFFFGGFGIVTKH